MLPSSAGKRSASGSFNTHSAKAAVCVVERDRGQRKVGELDLFREGQHGGDREGRASPTFRQVLDNECPQRENRAW